MLAEDLADILLLDRILLVLLNILDKLVLLGREVLGVVQLCALPCSVDEASREGRFAPCLC